MSQRSWTSISIFPELHTRMLWNVPVLTMKIKWPERLIIFSYRCSNLANIIFTKRNVELLKIVLHSAKSFSVVQNFVFRVRNSLLEQFSSFIFSSKVCKRVQSFLMCNRLCQILPTHSFYIFLSISDNFHLLFSTTIWWIFFI